MQLQHLVNYHKAMGDPTRIRILALLSKGPLHGQAIAGKLGLTPPTITHHMAKLREVGIIYERRDKNTIYFYLHKENLRRDAEAILHVIQRGDVEMDTEKERVLKNFFTAEGKLKSIPVQRKKKLYVFEHLVSGLKLGQKYAEKEINEYIKQFHDDFATIRREFIMNHYMYREDGIYELNPPEMWAKGE
ncbi:MAG: metalloregulator ArsR/SmtB family transcription factor [Clostridia bacterium]